MRREIQSFTHWEKCIGPGVFRIDNIPVSVITGGGKEDLELFTSDVSERLYAMSTVARQRLAAGETSVNLDFNDTSLILPSPRACRRIRERIQQTTARAS